MGASIAYKKVDSLLRGHTLAELAACLQGGAFPFCVVAPAFPYQGRVTRSGVQFRRTAGGTGRQWLSLRAPGGRPACQPPRGAPWPLWRPVSRSSMPRRTMVCAVSPRSGVGRWPRAYGAAALGWRRRWRSKGAAPSAAALKRPVLGLFGSDQAVTAGQLAACGPHHIKLADGGPRSAAVLGERLGSNRCRSAEP